MCVGCGRRGPATELVRVALVTATDGTAAPARGRGWPGRGAWLCGRACLVAARRRRGFQRAWRTDVPDRVLEQLERLFSDD